MLTTSDVFVVAIDDALRSQAASATQYLADNINHSGIHPNDTLNSILAELCWRRLLGQQHVPYTIVPTPQVGCSAVGGRPCLLHLSTPTPASAQNHNALADIIIEEGHPILRSSQRQRIEVFADQVLPMPNSGLPTQQPANWWIMPHPFGRGKGLAGKAAKVTLMPSMLVNMQVELIGLDGDQQPVNELVSIQNGKPIASVSGFSYVSCLVAKQHSRPIMQIGFAGREPVRTRWYNIWHQAHAIRFIGYDHSDALKLKLANKLDLDTAYRVRWFTQHVHIIKAVELNPLPRFFALAKKLDHSINKE